MHAIMVREFGGPEAMAWTELPTPVPGAGEALVRVGVAGVNFMDTGVRSTRVQTWSLPTVLGVEGVGRVVELGPGVAGLQVGQRVAWVYHPGSYAEYVAVPAAALVAVPDDIDDETAGGVMMQGLTANHFSTEVYPVAPGDTAVVHAAAGGVGLLLTQLITARGGRVIGIVSREEKVAAAREAGADQVLIRQGGGFQDEVLELTGGEGADVVYDGGGAPTFTSSLQSLRHHGTMAFYGPFMGSPTLRPTDLPKSIRLTYPTFSDHVRTHEALVRRSGEIFELIRNGKLRVRIGGRYPLSRAADAHVDIESRRTTGKLLLIPS